MMDVSQFSDDSLSTVIAKHLSCIETMEEIIDALESLDLVALCKDLGAGYKVADAKRKVDAQVSKLHGAIAVVTLHNSPLANEAMKRDIYLERKRKGVF